jgi:hypothetical protein
MRVKEETQPAPVPKSRVATRPGPSGLAEHRRRIYQRHLLAFAAVCAVLIAIDQVTTPGIQWAYYPIAPWLLVFALHTAGLLSRGYSIGELLIPPRQAPIKDVYTVPLDYELVRSRQLHDGINNVAHAVRERDRQLADDAVAAADKLLDAMEKLVARARGEKYRAPRREVPGRRSGEAAGARRPAGAQRHGRPAPGDAHGPAAGGVGARGSRRRGEARSRRPGRADELGAAARPQGHHPQR